MAARQAAGDSPSRRVALNVRIAGTGKTIVVPAAATVCVADVRHAAIGRAVKLGVLSAESVEAANLQLTMGHGDDVNADETVLFDSDTLEDLGLDVAGSKLTLVGVAASAAPPLAAVAPVPMGSPTAAGAAQPLPMSGIQYAAPGTDVPLGTAHSVLANAAKAAGITTPSAAQSAFVGGGNAAGASTMPGGLHGPQRHPTLAERAAAASEAAAQKLVFSLKLAKDLYDNLASQESLERRLLFENERMAFDPLHALEREGRMRVVKLSVEKSRMRLLDRAAYATDAETRQVARAAITQIEKVANDPMATEQAVLATTRLAELAAKESLATDGEERRMVAHEEAKQRAQERRERTVRDLKDALQVLQYKVRVPPAQWQRAEQVQARGLSHVSLAPSLAVEELQQVLSEVLAFIEQCRA